MRRTDRTRAHRWRFVTAAVTAAVSISSLSSTVGAEGGTTDNATSTTTTTTTLSTVPTDSAVREPSPVDPPAPELAPPGSPVGVSASPMDDGALVAWSAPTTGGPVSEYFVKMSSPCGRNWQRIASTTAASTHVGGLTAGANYCFMVLASNDAGLGWSGTASVTMPEGEGDTTAPAMTTPDPTTVDTTTPETTTLETTTPETTAPETTTPETTTTTPHHSMPDVSGLPPPIMGVDHVVIGPQVYAPQYRDGVGAFRINCTYSHLNTDDPIVYPGQAGAAHLHLYFGNDAVDAHSNAESIATTGGSTCTGGTANRTAYWVPAMVDADGRVIVSSDENFLQVYYKTGYQGVASDEVVNFPAGLRMIAGDMQASAPGDLRAVRYSCLSRPGTHSASIPTCSAGDVMLMTVQFPQCWDGINLDTADHQSHMAYASPSLGGCPAAHPVALPEITQNFRYVVPSEGMNGWRLASDMYDGPAGYSGHADWWNGWDAATFQKVVDNCYSAGLDCLMNNLGDGTRLE